MANIYKKKDSKGNEVYYARIPLGRTSNGAYKYKTLESRKKKDLTEKIKAFEKDLGIYGIPLDQTEIIFEQWFHTHLMINCHKTVKPKTFSYYISIYNNHLLKAQLGKMSLKDIKPLHLQEFFNERTHLAPNTLKKIKAIFSSTFKSAISNNLIRVNPAVNLELPISDKETKVIKILTLTEQKKYINVASQITHGLLFTTILQCGLRIGEALALQWSDIDLKVGIIYINKTVTYTRFYNDLLDTYEKKFIVGSPKTINSIRSILIPPSLLTKLKMHLVKSTHSLVFCTNTGNYIFEGSASRVHRKICAEIGVSGVNIHALRHTYATNLTSCQLNPKAVQDLIGHADIQTTFNNYVHTTDEDKRKAMEIIESIYSETRSTPEQNIIN